MRRLLALLGLAGILASLALWAGGCSSLKKTVMPVDYPHTIIFISGPVDTVNHTAHLHWYGTSTHGYIAGYNIRMLNPLQPADTNWVFTTRTDSVLTIYTPTGYARPVFEVAAIDDHGRIDPTPARETFQFSNLPPIVRLIGKPNSADHSDTTFASVTVTWTVDDPDGNAGAVVCRVWLDGQAGNPVLTGGTQFTMPSARFLTGPKASRQRRLYIQGIDDGGMAGPIDSVTWFVKCPVPDTTGRARLLVIDDVPTSAPSNVRADSLYATAVANTGIPAQSIRWIQFQTSQPFRSAMDLQQTFAQFDAVVWYRGEQSSFSSVLALYGIGSNGEGLGPYLDGGGRFMIESLNLVQAWSNFGPLTQSFVQRYLNVDGTFQYAAAPDSSDAWGTSNNKMWLQCPGVQDSLYNQRAPVGINPFVARDASQILFMAPVNFLSQHNAIPMPVAMNVRQANNGRFIAVTYPLVSGSLPQSSPIVIPQRASAVLAKILVLLTGP